MISEDLTGTFFDINVNKDIVTPWILNMNVFTVFMISIN